MGDMSEVEIVAWQGNGLAGAPNIWVFTGRLTLQECQSRVGNSTDGAVDGVCFGDNEVTFWPLDEDTRVLTVFFENQNTTGQTQSANMVIRETVRDRVGYG